MPLLNGISNVAERINAHKEFPKVLDTEYAPRTWRLSLLLILSLAFVLLRLIWHI